MPCRAEARPERSEPGVRRHVRRDEPRLARDLQRLVERALAGEGPDVEPPAEACAPTPRER